MTLRTLFLTGVAMAAVTVPAQAQDGSFVAYGGGALEFSLEPNGSGSDDTLELEAYAEAESRGYYVGAWVNIGSDSDLNEVDLYLGYRNELSSGLAYDVGYTRYYYPGNGGDCCGEFTLGVDFPTGDVIGVSTDLAYDPSSELGNAYVEVSYWLNDKFSVSGNAGVYEVAGASSESEWDFGIGYQVNDTVSLDARFYDGTEYDSYLGFRVNFDTTLAGG